MQRWIAKAAGGTVQRLNPAVAMMRSRLRKSNMPASWFCRGSATLMARPFPCQKSDCGGSAHDRGSAGRCYFMKLSNHTPAQRQVGCGLETQLPQGEIAAALQAIGALRDPI